MDPVFLLGEPSRTHLKVGSDGLWVPRGVQGCVCPLLRVEGWGGAHWSPQTRRVTR